MKQKVTDAEIIATWPNQPSVTNLAGFFQISERALATRIAKIRARDPRLLPSPDSRSPAYVSKRYHGLDDHPGAIQLGIQDGHVLVCSDAHYWPGVVSTGHKAFLEFCREFKPKAVICNGDEADFPSISRHAPIAWERRPKVIEEIDNLKAMLGEIEKVSPGARHIWTLGNHDARFETRLATMAPEYAGVHGVHLKDNFPNWEPCWAALVNDSTVIKHRFKSGLHAPHNNTMWAGRSILTGHLHSLKVMPVSDYNGTRWGVDCGTLADPYGPQFYNYTELNPVNWRSGFALLTYVKGRLLWPETIWVSGPDEVEFRGKVMRV